MTGAMVDRATWRAAPLISWTTPDRWARVERGRLHGALGIVELTTPLVVPATDGRTYRVDDAAVAQPVELIDHAAYVRVVLDDVPAVAVGSCRELDFDEAVGSLAQELTETARQALELAVHYAIERVQFGRPIGSFQAVQHRLADLAMLVDAASLVLEDAAAQASEVKIICSRAAVGATAGAHQVLGGQGIAASHLAHTLYRSALVGEQLLGSPDWHRRRLAAIHPSASL